MELQAEDHPHEQAHHHDDHQRQGAGVVHLLDHEMRPRESVRRIGQQAQQKQIQRAESLEERPEGVPDVAQPDGHESPRARICSR